MFGNYPFNAGSEFELFLEIKKQEIKFDYPGLDISQDLIDLLKKMLAYDWKQRISLKDICSHPIFQKETNLLQNEENKYLNIINELKN